MCKCCCQQQPNMLSYARAVRARMIWMYECHMAIWFRFEFQQETWQVHFSNGAATLGSWSASRSNPSRAWCCARCTPKWETNYQRYWCSHDLPDDIGGDAPWVIDQPLLFWVGSIKLKMNSQNQNCLLDSQNLSFFSFSNFLKIHCVCGPIPTWPSWIDLRKIQETKETKEHNESLEYFIDLYSTLDLNKSLEEWKESLVKSPSCFKGLRFFLPSAGLSHDLWQDSTRSSAWISQFL